MKKTIILGLMSVALMLPVQAQETDQFKPSGKIFGLLFANYHTTFSGRENVSVFEVTRSYLGFDYSFSRTIMSRVMFDGMTQTIDGKLISTGYLRNAYLQYDNGKLTLRGGLIGVEQLSTTEKFWNYRYIIKPPMDYAGMIFSADLGLMAKYQVTGAVSVDIGLLNGRGYKDIAPDTTLKFISGITIRPAKNILFRGYFDAMGPGGGRQMTFSLMGAYLGPVFSLGAEYFRQNNHLTVTGEHFSGISIFTAVKVAEKFSAFARYDNLGSVITEGEIDPWNISKDGTNLCIGFDYSPVKNVRISPNFRGIIPDDAGSDFVGNVGLNVEARF
ncbi:MAG: hypothetical protein WCD55_00035 [Bacteroidales bacterium]